MHDIDTKTLRLFVAVCDHRNMARAALDEHIEPSAISKRITQLEADLGVPLLVRSRRGVHPTPAGASLLEHARGVLFAVERMAADMSAFSSGVNGHVRLLATASAIAESLLDDLALFMREPANRNIKVDIEERISRDLVRQLVEGSASVGVCWDGSDLKGLQHRPYRQDRLALAVHEDHPLARRKSLKFEEALGFEHVGVVPSSAVQIMLRREAARSGRTVSYRAIVSNFDAALRVVAAGLAVSVIPREIRAPGTALSCVKVIPLTDRWAQRRFVVCCREFSALQVAPQRMVDYLVARAGPQPERL